MKIIYLLTRSILLFGIVFCLLNCQNGSLSNAQTTQQNENKTNKSTDNPYESLRRMALDRTPETLGLKIPSDKTRVYGVVMDWHTGDGIATFAFLQTGDASLYTSTGGGVIGGGYHENVKKATLAFIDKAQTYLDKATKTETTPLPPENTVTFYFLTSKGKFVVQEREGNFDNKSSQWLGLFIEANKVITELRLISEKD
jgi:hypothetical protein